MQIYLTTIQGEDRDRIIPSSFAISCTIFIGGMAEWSMATVLKTVRPARVSWVRIPLPPPQLNSRLAQAQRAMGESEDTVSRTERTK